MAILTQCLLPDEWMEAEHDFIKYPEEGLRKIREDAEKHKKDPEVIKNQRWWFFCKLWKGRPFFEDTKVGEDDKFYYFKNFEKNNVIKFDHVTKFVKVSHISENSVHCIFWNTKLGERNTTDLIKGVMTIPKKNIIMEHHW